MWRYHGAALLAVLATACASSGGTGAAPTAAGPLPGDNYVIVYSEGDAVRRLDTRAGADDVVIADVDTVLLATPSGSGGRLGLAYRRGDSTVALAVDVETGGVTDLHHGARGTAYTGAWSVDEEHFAVGFRPSTGRGGVVMYGPDDRARNIGCRASDRVEAWRSGSTVIVHDAVNFYTVSTNNCSTLARFSKPGKRDPAFAPNGSRVAYFVNRSVRFANRADAEIIPELWAADHNGSNAKVVADYQSRPRHAVLSPDGRRVAYEVVSRRWANTTHVVVYAFRTDAYSYIAEEESLGVPNDFAVCWSPDGRRVAHERLYARSSGAQSYVTRQVVVREGDAESHVFEEIIGESKAQVLAKPPRRCRWVGTRHLLIDSRSGQRIVDVDDGETLEVLPERRVLGVRVFEK